MMDHQGGGGGSGTSMEPLELSHKGDDANDVDFVSPASDSLRHTLQDIMSRESYQQVQGMKREIDKLTKFERLLLYLELPSSLSGMTDPLRQPLNPLGSRHEIQLTITWIKTHLEEDSQVSLPKHEVYDDYLEYCGYNGLKQLSTADFGKVMKQVFPQVRPRRLGTRGNSRYCYAGLKKRLKLEDPRTPELSGSSGKAGDHGVKLEPEGEEIGAATSLLIREWVEKLLGVKFGSLAELAMHLIDKMYVDNRSAAAFTVASAIQKSCEGPPSSSRSGHNSQAVGVPDYNRKIEMEAAVSKRSSLKRKGLAAPHETNNFMGDGRNDEKGTFEAFLSASTGRGIVAAPPATLPAGFPNHAFNNLASRFPPPPQQPPPQRPTVTTTTCSSDELPPPPPPPPLPASSTAAAVLKDPNVDEELGNYFKDGASVENDHESLKLSQLRQLLEEKLQSSTTTMNMVSNSAFKPAEHQWNEHVVVPSQQGDGAVASTATNGAVASVAGVAGNGAVASSLSSRRRVSFNPLVVQDPAAMVVDSASCATVSTSVVAAAAAPAGGGGGGMTGTGPSPGTRKRHFSFQPISPRQASLPHSPSASPFISPRSTPVPMAMRSRHSSGNALPLHLLPQNTSQQQKIMAGGAFTSSSSDISRAATFGSASECSTPFISPHGTPVHFNRSRHNSAQGRLCRSRHSSGIGPYRYGMAFSPMALNNLNNPYSPQPATPVGASSSSEEMFASTMMQQPMMEEDLRSRHSSSGSCELRSSPMSPNKVKDVMMDEFGIGVGGGGVGGGGGGGGQPNFKRQRHASAGSYQQQQQPPPDDWNVVQEQQQQQEQPQNDGDQLLRSQSLPFDQGGGNFVGGGRGGGGGGGRGGGGQSALSTADLDSTSNSTHNGKGGGGGSGGHHGGGSGGHHQDELDMTLSALKDCDTEFSKFVQDQEVGSGK